MSKGHKHQHQEQGEGHQEQTQGEQPQEQMPDVPLDPVYEQVHAYEPPANPLASDPITEAPSVPTKELEKEPEKEEKKESEHGSSN